MIESNINKKYFREQKMDVFFEKIFSLSDTNALLNLPEFKAWLQTDLFAVTSSLSQPESCMEMAKMIVFLKLDDDPELVELLCDVSCKRIKSFTTD
jgi:hypothetical protein